jgi:phosphoglycerate dehydrogenase-like enzyme
MKYKVLFTESYLTPEGRKILEEGGCQVDTEFLRFESEDKLIHALQDYDGVIAGGELYSERVMKSLKKLKIIARLGAGTDQVDLKAAARAGVEVCNTPGATARAVAEMTMALMLSFTRRVPWHNDDMKKGIWNQNPTAMEITGSTVGIVGMGYIGREVIRLLQSFSAEIVAYDIVWNEAFAAENQVRRVSLPQLMEISDIVSIHTPLTDETRGFINASLLKKMKPTAFVINTSRGPVIDKHDLLVALQNKQIAGAALDALWEEPPEPDDPVIRMENVIAVPHVAFNTNECKARMVRMAAEEVLRVLSGQGARYSVLPR